MKHITAALLLSFVLLTAACVQPLKGFEFASKSECATAEENITITTAGNNVTFSGSINTPTPCYDLKADSRLDGNEVVVSIKTAQKKGVCIQCIGSHLFEGSFMLDNGTYSVKILVNDEVFKKQTITVG